MPPSDAPHSGGGRGIGVRDREIHPGLRRPQLQGGGACPTVARERARQGRDERRTQAFRADQERPNEGMHAITGRSRIAPRASASGVQHGLACQAILLR